MSTPVPDLDSTNASRLGARFLLSLIVLVPLALGLSAQQADVRGKVRRVIDGDTIEVEGVGRVRLIGIDTPEPRDHREVVRELARAATDYTTRHLLDEDVRLDFDWQRRDRYGRTLAYVYLPDGTFFNAKIVRDGYAFAFTRYPFRHLEQFRRLEREARMAGEGLWRQDAGEAALDQIAPARAGHPTSDGRGTRAGDHDRRAKLSCAA